MTESTIELIRLTDVNKSFTLRTEKSLKETILNFFTRRKRSHKFHALSHLSLSINSGTTLGLIGHNGSGKSTLLKIIGGILEPTTGVVERRGKLAALLELGAGFHPDLTGRENVYLNASILGLSKFEIDEKFAEIVDFSGINDFIDTQVKFYSSGMYVRLAFSVAINVDPDILLVDEVLAVGDELFQQKCIAKIKQFQSQGRTIIIVSHAPGQIIDLCDSVVLLEDGRPTFIGAPREGIDRLRKSLLKRDGRKSDTDSSVSSGPYLVTRLLSSSGTQQTTFSAGSSFIIETNVHLSPHQASGCTLELTCQSSDGLKYHCSQGNVTKLELPSLGRECTVSFTVQDSHSLPAGTYSLVAKVFDADSQLLAEALSTDCFSITSREPSALTERDIQGTFVVASVE